MCSLPCPPDIRHFGLCHWESTCDGIRFLACCGHSTGIRPSFETLRCGRSTGRMVHTSRREYGIFFYQSTLKNGIANSSIEVDGETLSLADALESGRITQEEIAYLARLDARNGYCEQIHATQNGLTHFTYQYPTFNLRIVYDVYVTPDGGEDLINHVTIYPVRDNEIFGPYVNFYNPVTGERTDLEDWGLTFSLVSASPTGVTIDCQQAGGQQIGQLSVDWYFLSDEDGFVTQLDASAVSPTCDTDLNRNADTTIALDWTDVYGQLPGGTYQLTLNIIDHFEEADVHPLMQNNHDWQQYTIDFSIP